MEAGLVNLITSKDENWDKRWKYNCAMFILCYIFMGAVTGITNDSYLSYLNITVPNVVKALPTYASIGTFIIAMLLNSKSLKGRTFFRSIFYIPTIIPYVATAMVFMWLMSFVFNF